ncbi:MAG: RNA methyltransferase [Bacteroidaceae bacterium]|nr:RNA methyltransferase [Bacteroidaceae bacterium]
MISKNKIKLIRSLALKKNRDADKVFVAEGRKLVADLLPHFSPLYLAATAEWMSANPALSRYFPAEMDVVTDDELQRASLQQSPQGVLAIFRQQSDDTPLADVASRELCLMLDDVQNPGNLGTIVRLADWFGIRHVYCSQGTADIYGPKTVQATMGSLARVRVHYSDLPVVLRSLPSSAQIPVYGTFLDAPSLYDAPLSQHGIIVMGNEGNGISPSVAQYVNRRLFIPPYPEGRDTAESLNVAIATAIVCAEFRRH